MIPIAKPLIGEEEKQAVFEVLNSGVIAQGQRVKAFEEAFAAKVGVKYAIATSSGTTALNAALLAHGIGPGDEVITSPFTFIASANSILYTGAHPVFVDIDPITFNINPDLIEAAITEKTKAIMPVHLFGLICAMDRIMEIAQRHNLVVIEDACQAHGGMFRGQGAGSFGTGCFSFYPTKNMTSAEGGMITTNDPEIDESCRVIRQHGMRRRYYHDELGFNFRMTDVHAAIGCEQLKKLDQFNNARIANAKFLSSGLKNKATPIAPAEYKHVYHQYTIRVPAEQRERVIENLQEHDVGYGIYYPVPIHQQTIYKKHGYGTETLPEAEQAANEVISLPVHPALSGANLETIVTVINQLSI